MIASMPSRPLFHISRDRLCIAACNGMASAACPRYRVIKPAKRKFRSYQATSISILLRCGPRKASSICLLQSIGHQSSPMPSCMRRPIAGQSFNQAVLYKIHTVLTDNGIQFTDLPKNRLGPRARWRVHMFDRLCDANGIEHRLTKPNHPWTNGQVERMNRTLKAATVQRHHCRSHASSKRTSTPSSWPITSPAPHEPQRPDAV
jgi:hypothetical protein